ncbi:hypothetical protein C0993_003957 [Termitomyces sp. T159_Od127]|nr:hypothetical protein C0993_003957 [Termitomyces sp. T159_Od127]
MSSAYPSDPPASRTWWALGSKHSSQHDLERQLSHKPSRYSGLNSIAVALGIKSKKRPVLAIQDPGYPPSRPAMPTVAKTSSRPPSKAASSIQSPIDSLGPRTPQDSQRDNRQSLLTFAENDPFAVAHTVSSAPQSPFVQNRLAVFSSSSNPDVIAKNTESILSRVSYASSSSQSNAHGNDLPPLSPTIPNSIKKPKQKQSLMSGDQLLESAWETLTSANKLNAGSFTTSLDENRTSHPATGRPSIRTRSMTDSGQRPESATLTALSSTSSHTPSRSRTIIRQPSVSRILSPPSAPPKQQLPLPPSGKSKAKGVELEPVASFSPGSASSSSLSFASSISSEKDILFNQQSSFQEREKVSLQSSISTRAGMGSVLDTSNRGRLSPPSHTLNKAMSHQSLKRRPPPTSSVPVPPPELLAPLKAPHKQRSFHHPKFSLPPLSPTRSNTSSGLQSSTPIIDSQTNAEHRRGGAGGFSLPVRKRLFSTGSSSRRPSTSPSIVPEDDNRSVFSVRSVPDHSIGTAIIKPLGQPLSPNHKSSFWDEVSFPDQMPPGPRTITREYTPQQIMSPAEMAKLEANVDDSKISDTSSLQEFSLPFTSITAMMSSDGDRETFAAETTLTSTDPVAFKPMSRSTSLVRKGLSSPQLSERPSTSHVNMATPTISERSSPVSSLHSPSMTSLPPPPRRVRPRATFVDDSNTPSLPPPPSRKSVRSKISVEKTLQRRSIMRKSSFLEIDDNSDEDTDIESMNEPPSGSFLDLARESFDTTSE